MFAALFRNKSRAPVDEGVARGFKLTTTERKRKVGVAAKSLKILKEKAAEKLKVKNCRLYLSTDGTEVDDEEYFRTIADQSLLVVAGPKEEIKTDFQLMIDSFRTANATLLEAAEGTHAFVENNRDAIKGWLQKLLDQNAQGDSTDNGKLSLKTEDPDWFQGTDSKYRSKEEAMCRRAQDRIRGYFYKAKDELTKTELYRAGGKGKIILDTLLTHFRMFLHGCDHFGCLFDRSLVQGGRDQLDTAEPLNKRQKVAITEIFNEENPFGEQCRTLCSNQGLFRCQGAWNVSECPRDDHQINPYSSREALVLFQTWNLDHQIEFGRTVIPRIISSVGDLLDTSPSCPDHQERMVSLNSIRFFLELFTVANLKLVHITCHIKGSHDLPSNGGLVCKKCPDYIKMTDFCNKIEDN